MGTVLPMETGQKIIGYTTDYDECQKCGRTNLKGCVIVADDVKVTGYYGPECAQQVVTGRGPKVTVSDAQRIERVRRDKLRWWAREVHKHIAAADKAWLGQDIRDARFLHFVREDELALLAKARQTFRELCAAAAA